MLGGVVLVAQVLPQSCANTPIPRIPFALSVLTLFSAPPVVWLEQLAGTLEKLVGAMTCTGIEAAISPATCTCASETGAEGSQLKPHVSTLPVDCRRTRAVQLT